jgi:hypothetical protein
MCCIKDTVSIVQGIITIVGIIVAGIWTYLLFIRQRISYPRLNVELVLQNAPLPEKTRLIHVQVNLKNNGNVLVRSDYAELRLRKIVPLPKEIIPTLKEKKDPVPEAKSEYEWPLFVRREWKFYTNDFEIEPSENDSLHADFFIPDDFQVIQLYFFIRNPRKKRKDFGWTETNIYSFNSKETN